MRVGFVGAGRMGRPMVARLAAAGHDVRVLVRDPDDHTKRRDLEQLGATVVNEVADAAAQADAVVVCVFTDEQVREVCLDSVLLSTMPSGSTLVVHTTSSPKTIEAIAARSGAVDVVDAPVSGGPHNIAAGELTVFVGGADDIVARLQPLLACYGDPVLHVGPRGAGQTVKLVNNALFAGHIGLLAESIRLGERLGVPESTLLGALAHGSATSRVRDIVAAHGSLAGFVEVAGEFVGKDVAVVRSIAEELGISLGALDDIIGVLDVSGKV
ncbi:NAD(P)-dependent oxidoreductase [Mycobacterium montefiorense]|uniref:6-phosphogluconate dehydrogenase n=1 Tax=Mycobacterium montefiorense TaxID=154654 RepID=A0AA37UVU2_9MYCO|nr:NAD(P)-dependent oxidoreductase [Mycobacterium montefiorense]GBG40226.1 6-phosphogluconate dehydrogenase [Mycobacterium montefiorense]GKU35249.1 6-phosphogluconate dehydrogenase [Mycobacterium montefiorense]GKU40203.1 6-phosphogluconate dehydrogenase [Mycobacterium montefiorense]GKU46142.1 6-phosphogluconate dehydrogenase [Mycobacterium montefiorense]GKU53014.1 6-phosphogluconate dehydrogenase [Mycobacterium montefiorense]